MERPLDRDNKKGPDIDFAASKIRITKYCVYQERAHAEVEQKLYSFGLFANEVEELLAWLITENFVNEERFAKAFAGGKFRLKKWGKIKISQQLKLKRVYW